MIQSPVASLHGTRIHKLLDQIGLVLFGTPDTVRLAVCCLLARGHLLIEDIPGVGKTTLASALARSLGLDLRRVQFTSDLLPGDIIGTSVFERTESRFVFHKGAIFAQVVLADEINRASPKTQSALLEAMEERQVTVDGHTHALPAPFFVIATQNPNHQIGTFPLPESQLDRFLMRIAIGYPDRAGERAMLMGEDRRRLLERLAAVMTPAELIALQEAVVGVQVAPALVEYLLDVIAITRRDRPIGSGLSPRGGMALLRAAQAWAVMAGRGMVLPEDVQAVAGSVIGHRLRLDGGLFNGALSHAQGFDHVTHLIRSVGVA
jgi:MoxR-like ATPase